MGALCLKRPINYSYGDMAENSQRMHDSKYQMQSNSYINMGQHQSLNAVRTMDVMMKMQTIENHPSMELQNKIYIAKENDDIQTLIDLMNSKEPTAYQIDMGHPWANSPQTIGSVSLMYMQILLMREIQFGEQGYDKQEEKLSQNIKIILQNNIIKQLEQNLFQKDQDRIQISVLLMVFLVEYQEILNSFYEFNLFDTLLPFMYLNDKNPVGFRISIAYLCRELYKNKQNYIKNFLQDKQAMDCIIDFLYSDNILFIIEGLNNIDELCKEDDFIKISVYNPFEILYEYGFINHLQKVQNKLDSQRQSVDEDIDVEMNSDRNFTICIIKSLINRILQNCKKTK